MSRRKKSCKRGVAAVEVAILLPIVLVVFFGVCELGWYVHCAQAVNNSARQGARTAVDHANSNAEVEAAVRNSLSNSLGTEASDVTVRISKLGSGGVEHYQVTSLDENENGDDLRILVSVEYAAVGIALNLLGLRDRRLSSYAVMRRTK